MTVDGKSLAEDKVVRSGSQALLPVCFSLGLTVAGCALSVPIPGFIADRTPTGSISAPSDILSKNLDQEDWRRAKAAMAVALDPQGNGALAAWANPATGAKGSFTASAPPRPEHDTICRAFRAEVAPAGQSAQQISGKACRDDGGDWRVADAAATDRARAGS